MNAWPTVVHKTVRLSFLSSLLPFIFLPLPSSFFFSLSFIFYGNCILSTVKKKKIQYFFPSVTVSTCDRNSSSSKCFLLYALDLGWRQEGEWQKFPYFYDLNQSTPALGEDSGIFSTKETCKQTT